MKKKADSDSPRFANYVACFLDLLGQADKLLSTPLLLPHSSEKTKHEEFINGLAQTFLPARTIQNDFESAFGPSDLDLSKLSQADREVMIGLRKLHVKFQRFSDGFVAYLDLANKEAAGLPYNVLQILSSACYVMITSLAGKNPIRGGIAVGWGTEFENNFYGAVIAKAHHLESQVAAYPRIVIDTHLLDYLQSIIDEPTDDTAFSRGNKHAAALAQSYICQDEYDGQWVLDYLGRVFLDNFMNDDSLELIRSAHAFVKHERQNFSVDGTAPNTKLAMRYAMLDHYFTQRLTQAGVIE